MTRTKLHTALAVALGTALTAGLATTAPSALAGITNSKHNLGSTATGGAQRNNSTTKTNEICVFCHTPHGANTSEPAAPLWNKVIPTAASYTMYAGSASYNADDDLGAAGGSTTKQPGGVSLACLSCHDGTQAIDSMINAPGSGWGAGTGAAPVSQGYDWTNGAGSNLDLSNSLQDNAVTNIGGATGTALNNDHPISMAYAGGLKDVATGTWDDRTDYRDDGFWPATDAGGNNWFVDADADGLREKTDMILYYYNTQPQVECASCHDPHSDNALFLRGGAVGNAGSAVCLACHDK